MELRRLLSRAVLALTLLGGSLAIDGAIGEAEAAAKKSSSAKKKAASSSAKKKAASGSASAKPALRASSGPTEVGEEEAEGEGEPGEEAAEGGSTESELAAIEAEILAEIAAGRLPAEAPLEAEAEVEEKVDDTPRWVTHTVIPGETLDGVAGRYGVATKSLVRWNKLDAKAKGLRAGRDLRVQAVRPPPPRVETSVEVKKGDTWEKIASAHGVTEKELRLWNKPKKAKDGSSPKATLKAGQRLTLWVEPEGAGATSQGGGPRLLAGRVRANAFSIGSPTRGRLVNGVELPELPEIYTRRSPEKSYGSSHTVRTLILAIAQFRKQARYDGPVVIGAISLPRGGRFRPHRSHQSGRDVDIRLPTLPSVQHSGPPSAGEIDWTATWRLLESFIKTGQVQYIFLDYGLQKRLYKAARAAGAAATALAEVLQWPRDARSNNGIVRHSPGHRSHFHVRVKCGPNESKCDAGR